MRASLAHRLVLTLVPAMLIASVAVSAVWGTNGLLTRAQLARELEHATVRLGTIERENQRLLRDIQVMQSDPQVLERVVAEELAWGRKDAVLYRFEPSEEGE